MQTTFDFIQIWIPTLEKFKSFSLITNHQYKSLVKYSTNFDFNSVQWNMGFTKCLLRIAQENCLETNDFKFSQLSMIDYLVIFLNLKAASIDPKLSLTMKCEQTGKEFRKDLILDDIERELLKFPYKKKLLNFENKSLNITVGCPRIYLESIETDESVYLEQISSVLYTFGNIDVENILFHDLLRMVENLPATISKEIYKYYERQEEIAKNLILFKLISPYSGQAELTQTFSISKNFLIQFCKLLFQDDLESVYKMYYRGMKDLKLDSKFVDDITPIELRAVFFKFYKTDIEQERKENEKSESSGNGIPMFNPSEM